MKHAFSAWAGFMVGVLGVLALVLYALATDPVVEAE
jgi:hypothetical protein